MKEILKIFNNNAVLGFLCMAFGALATSFFTYYRIKIRISFEEKKARIGFVKKEILVSCFEPAIKYTEYCMGLIRNGNFTEYKRDETPFSAIRKIDFRFGRNWNGFLKKIDNYFYDASQGKGLNDETLQLVELFQMELYWHYCRQARNLDACYFRLIIWRMFARMRFGGKNNINIV